MRKKPHHTRKRFAFLISVCATGVVIALWSLTLPARLASITIKGSDLVGGTGAAAIGDQLQEGRSNLQQVIETGGALSQDFSEQSFEYNTGEINAPAEISSDESARNIDQNTTSLNVSSVPSQEVKKAPTVLISTSTSRIGGETPN